MQVTYCSKHTDLNGLGYADALLGIMCTTYGHLFADPWLFSYHKPTYLRKQDLLFYRISDLELFRFSFFVLPCRLPRVYLKLLRLEHELHTEHILAAGGQRWHTIVPSPMSTTDPV